MTKVIYVLYNYPYEMWVQEVTSKNMKDKEFLDSIAKSVVSGEADVIEYVNPTPARVGKRLADRIKKIKTAKAKAKAKAKKKRSQVAKKSLAKRKG